MPKTYYDSELTAEQIEAALKAIADVVNPGNNGKVMFIEDGKIKAASASRWSGSAVLEPLSVTANGDYTPPTGTDGFDSVHVAVPSYPEPTGTIQITQNGTVNVKDYASAEVNVSGGGGNLQVKSITENGIILPDSGYDGFSRVIVAVDVGDSGPFSLDTYIEATGTQWIDTGYIIQDNTRFEAVATIFAKSISSNPISTLYGVRNADQSGGCSFWIEYPTTSYRDAYQWSSGSGAPEFIYLPSTRDLKAEYNITKQYVSYLTSDSSIQNVDNTKTGSATQQYSLYLFSLNEGGSEYGQLVRGSLKLYRFRIYEGATLVHEYLPWLDTNNVACLKDTVTGNLFYNLGTGSLIYGTD